MRRLRFGRIALLAVLAGLICAAGAYATVIGLPADGSQVNNDPAAGIDPNQNAGVSSGAWSDIGCIPPTAWSPSWKTVYGVSPNGCGDHPKTAE